MKMNTQDITITELPVYEEPPYALLLLADPSTEQIDAYLPRSKIYTAQLNNATIGVIVLTPLNEEEIEIKNIAVSKMFQNQGIGARLIDNAVQIARDLNYKVIEIGTGNSSLGQLYLYQKCGFRMNRVLRSFFLENYAEPIYENGLRCTDMLVLSQQL